MIRVLKRVIMVLGVLMCVEMVVFGTLIFMNHGTAIGDDGKLTMDASDVISVREPIDEADTVAKEVTAELDKVTAESEANEQIELEVGEDVDYSYGNDYDYSDYGAGFVYDGSGFVNANVDGDWLAGSYFVTAGVHKDSSGLSYTYYSEKIFPGDGLNIPGRHVNEEGYVCDDDGNICLSSDDLPQYTVVSIPFGGGTGVVYDTGSGHGNLDVYTSWDPIY